MGKQYALVARVRPHDEEAYHRYLRETYYPGLCTMPGFVSMRILRWSISDAPSSEMVGGRVEYLRITTWASREAADAYYRHPLRATFGKLLDLADVAAYGGAEIVMDLSPAGS